MAASHKNKTIAVLLAFLLGSVGAHRFYLYGKKSKSAWVYVFLFPFSWFAALIDALSMGLMADERWDERHNADSLQKSRSNWIVVVLVILSFALGTTLFIAAIARLSDLWVTGGAYG